MPPVGVDEHQVDHGDRPIKRFRGETAVVAVTAPKSKTPLEAKPQTGLLGLLPEDVVSHCLSFLNTVEDRFALQTTCKQFQRISNSDKMLVNIQISGNRDTGKGGIIQDDDTPETAAVVLAPFSRAGNLEAIYMLGMIKSYCHQDVETGIRLLKAASVEGYVRSSYALGLVLRDSQPEEATKYMQLAAGEGYLPALQELLPAREMKAKYGEPNADALRRHLDPCCLNHLLGRHYVRSAELRELSTSHCWNPLCGRWAFKASVNTNVAAARIRRPWGLTFYRNGNGEAQPFGTGTDATRNDNAAGGQQIEALLNPNQNNIRNDNHGEAQEHDPEHGEIPPDENGNDNNDENESMEVEAAPPQPPPPPAPAPPGNNDGNDNVEIGGGVGDDNSTANAGPRAGPADADTRVDSSGTSDESSQSQPGNQNQNGDTADGAASTDVRVSRMKMCSRCCRAKYCSKLCQVYDWRSGRHKMECQFL
ncbi:zinc finger [Seminavis robusta]|uniref:Zinc finger n=1 Tax=Seminavis robusta TaxID=568900 RepID=A0A9N8DU84_9STRA|nr:zinc finger [Seminavis robusta]|eukprot:Sro361_g126420.1 zinc finger (478) ;mRNA; f:12664-14235